MVCYSILLLSAPLRSNGADYVLLLFIFFIFLFFHHSFSETTRPIFTKLKNIQFFERQPAAAETRNRTPDIWITYLMSVKDATTKFNSIPAAEACHCERSQTPVSLMTRNNGQ